MKIIFYSLIFILFIQNSLVFAKTEYWQCNDKNYKIVLPLIGFDKAYEKVYNTWKRIDDFLVLEDEFILYNQKVDESKCPNDECKIDIYISRLFTSGSFSNYKSVVSNDFCKIDGSGICYIRNLGKNLNKGYCNFAANIN